jgi:hypothetical protein
MTLAGNPERDISQPDIPRTTTPAPEMRLENLLMRKSLQSAPKYHRFVQDGVTGTRVKEVVSA